MRFFMLFKARLVPLKKKQDVCLEKLKNTDFINVNKQKFFMQILQEKRAADDDFSRLSQLQFEFKERGVKNGFAYEYGMGF